MVKPAFERDFQQTFTSLYFEWKLLSPPLHETWDFKTTPTLALMNILQTLFHDVWTVFNSLVPLQTPGWRETPWEWGVLSKHKTLAVSWAWARTKNRARPGVQCISDIRRTPSLPQSIFITSFESCCFNNLCSLWFDILRDLTNFIFYSLFLLFLFFTSSLKFLSVLSK